MEKRLVLEDQTGKVVRAYQWQGQAAQVIRRGDTRGLEILTSTDDLERQQIPFENLGEIQSETLSETPFLVGQLGHLRLIENIEDTEKDHRHEQETNKTWYLIAAAVFILALLMMTALMSRPLKPSEKMEEALKQEVVKIFKALPPKPKMELTAQMAKQTP